MEPATRMDANVAIARIVDFCAQVPHGASVQARNVRIEAGEGIDTAHL
jgi:hypothetical protein